MKGLNVKTHKICESIFTGEEPGARPKYSWAMTFGNLKTPPNTTSAPIGVRSIGYSSSDHIRPREGIELIESWKGKEKGILEAMLLGQASTEGRF